MSPQQAHPISLFCAAASADEALLAQWEKHLLPLQQAGLVTLWSERHLSAGDPRERSILEQLSQADVIILLLSADFFASLECVSLMVQALKRRQDEGTKVIPLLLRASLWQQSPLGGLVRLPANGLSVVQWPDQDEAFNACVLGLCKQLGLPPLQPATPSRSGVQHNPNRERMLRRLRRSYGDLLAQSLEGITWIELGLTKKPEAVQNVTNLALKIGQQSEQPLSDGTTILQVYEQAEEELLILGEPGSGKSTLLLHLAQHLVAQAEANEKALLPIILPLSSWAVKQAPLSDWMIEQIAQAYDVPHKASQQWVQEEQILPLLDGLDEMQETARPACIAAINAYHREHLTPLVVCSRTSEYESAASSQRLALQSSVVVRPLTHEQTEAAFVRTGESVAELRTALHEQPALQELATTPLMLSVLMLAYQGTSVPTSSLKETALEQQIWSDYIKHMVERKRQGHLKQYSLEQTRSRLGWLAQQMRRHDQTFFYAERLQADWLPDRLLGVYTWLAERIPALLLGILASLLFWLFLEGNVSDPTGLLQLGLAGAFFGGWLKEIQEQPRVSPTEPIGKKRSARPLGAFLGSSLIFGALAGASIGFELDSYYQPLDCLRAGLICGIGFGLGGFAWLSCLSLSESPSKTLPLRPRFFRTRRLLSIHVRRAATIALVSGVVYGLTFGLVSGLGSGLGSEFVSGVLSGLGSEFVSGVLGGLNVGLSFGFTGFLLSFILEKRDGRLRLAERLRWNGWSLLRRKHLGNSLLVAALLFLFLGLSFGLNREFYIGLDGGLSFGLISGLSFGLSFGLSYWLLFGLYQGVLQEQVEDQDRRAFNQGIRRSLRNGFFVSLLGGAMIGGIDILSIGLFYVLGDVLSDVLRSGLFSVPGTLLRYGLFSVPSNVLFLFLSGSLVIWAMIGGFTILRHYVIRLLLAVSHTFPWRAQAFLDAATAHILLRRVGGGYSFVHRRLLDYFADTYPSVANQSAASEVTNSQK